jgi:outer membrane protein TolC
MRAITFWSAWVVLLFSSAVVARADSISIEFEQLDEYARTTSTRARILEQEFNLVQTERDQDLKWSNPELAYAREVVDQTGEYQITVGKQIEMPWVYIKRRGAWEARMQAAELSRADHTSRLLAELRTGYIRLKILGEQQTRLNLLRDIITDASHVAASRHHEGQLSGVDEHLIQMFLITLGAQHQRVLQQQRTAESQWRASMGIDPDVQVALQTVVEFRAIETADPAQHVAAIENRPGYRYRTLLQESLARRAETERRRFIPAFNLYGGFKKIEPDLDGYVAGISLDLPLFNVNGAAARRFEVEGDIVARETEIYRRELSGRIEALVSAASELRHALGLVADHFHQDMEAVNTLLFSYQEGWMSLSEFLNAIQIDVTGMQDYYNQLIDYYSSLFELEAITGQKLVSFDQ